MEIDTEVIDANQLRVTDHVLTGRGWWYPVRIDDRGFQGVYVSFRGIDQERRVSERLRIAKRGD